MPSTIHKRASAWRFAGQPESGFAGLIEGHAFRDELVPAEQAMNEFARLAVVLKAGWRHCATDGRA